MHGKQGPNIHSFPPGQLARQEQHTGHTGTGGAPTAAVEQNSSWTAAVYMCVFGCGCIYVVSHICFAEPAGYLKEALLRSRLVCYVADCVWPSEFLCLVKFEQIPLLFPRGCAAPLRGISAIATLERFVVYCSCEQNILAAPPGAAQRARGIAQAVTVCRREKNWHGKKWPDIHSLPPGRLARRERHRRSPCCCTERLRVRCWTATHYIRMFAHACVYVASECAPIRRVLSNSQSLAVAAGVAGKEETAQSALAAAQLEAWLSLDRPGPGTCCCRWL